MARRKHPRDAFVTVFGRKPVLAALEDPTITIDKLLIDARARGPTIDRILARAKHRGLVPQRCSQQEVTRVSRSKRQDQGVVADVSAPHMDALSEASAQSLDVPVLVLDGITTPANMGMILRAATAAGMGVVLPRAGTPEVGPLVIKASAGVAFHARILRTPDVETGLATLSSAGFRLLGLGAGEHPSLWTCELPRHLAVIVGSETRGLSPAARARLSGMVTIPMAPGVESLNAATAAAIMAFELRRRGHGRR